MSVPLTRKTAVLYSLTMLATSGLFFNHLLHLRAAHAQTTSSTNVCADPWLNELLPARKAALNAQNLDGFANAIDGFGVQGECNTKLYNNGSWSSKAQLQTYVDNYIKNRRVGVCRDALVTQSINTAYGRAPKGFGESQDCNVYLYGGGSWSSNSDLLTKVITLKNDMAKSSLIFATTGMVRPAAPSTVIQRYPVGLSVSASGSTSNIILNGGGNIVAQGGLNIVAQGGGNIVAQGGGNIVAQGGLNLIGDGAQFYHTLAAGSGVGAKVVKVGSVYVIIPLNK